MKTQVVNIKTDPFDINIMRPSKWGNPFKLKREADRPLVLRNYRCWFMNQHDLMIACRQGIERKNIRLLLCPSSVSWRYPC